jgi:hypothetical protein
VPLVAEHVKAGSATGSWGRRSFVCKLLEDSLAPIGLDRTATMNASYCLVDLGQ